MATIFENEEFAIYQLEGSNKDSLNLAESDEVTHSQPIKILIDDEVRPQFAETFRLLAQSIQHLAKEENLHLDGRRVILIDADNRNPSLREMVDDDRKPTHHWFHSNLNYSGWSLDWVPDQEILLSVPEQDEQLESEAISQLLSSLSSTFDFILIDSPACGDNADAFRLAPLVDGVLYIVRRRQQDVGMQRRIKSQLELLGANFLGVIYNES
jgi:Mrp family chromosome partitioning ATPase